MSPSAPIILTTKQMYHDPPITNFHGWKISHDEWICPTAPPPLSLFLFSRETASRINPRSSGKYFQYPLFQRNQEKCRSQKSREKKRKRERESVRARVSQSNKKYRLFIVYCALPPLLLLITRATQIIRGDILKFPRVRTSYLDDVMSSFAFAAYSWSATRYLGNYSR